MVICHKLFDGADLEKSLRSVTDELEKDGPFEQEMSEDEEKKSETRLKKTTKKLKRKRTESGKEEVQKSESR